MNLPLHPCPACSRPVSPEAAGCPNCGHPIQATRPRSPWATLAKVVGAWVIAPWVARVLVFLAACVVAVVALSSR
jgi:predicted amidophosphoribosyltransferase